MTICIDRTSDPHPGRNIDRLPDQRGAVNHLGLADSGAIRRRTKNHNIPWGALSDSNAAIVIGIVNMNGDAPRPPWSENGVKMTPEGIREESRTDHWSGGD
jgi:hypothetical protein